MSEWQLVEGWDGDFYERWECEQPEPGVPFRVLEDEWDFDSDPPRRIIREVVLV